MLEDQLDNLLPDIRQDYLISIVNLNVTETNVLPPKGVRSQNGHTTFNDRSRLAQLISSYGYVPHGLISFSEDGFLRKLKQLK